MSKQLRQLSAFKELSRWETDGLVGAVCDLAQSAHPKQSLANVRRLLEAAQKVRWKNLHGWVCVLKEIVNLSSSQTPEAFQVILSEVALWHKELEDENHHSGAVWSHLRRICGQHPLLNEALRNPRVRTTLDESCKSWVERDHIADTLAELEKHQVEPLLPALNLVPGQWCRLLVSMNMLPIKRLPSIFSVAMEHPLFACGNQMRSPLHAVPLLQDMWRERCKTNPISTRLMEHLQGVRPLRELHYEHDIELLAKGWCEAQTHLLHELVRSELWRSFPGLSATSGIHEHSLWISLSATSNKRPLRQMLRAHAHGDTEWRLRHPANQRWMAKLPQITAQCWMEGIATTRTLSKLGPITLSPEFDPQSILQMGSVVRSCLSAGSCNSHGAIANALDLNKLVVFARNEKGKIVGRQLLAISDEGRLVCFSPYPKTLSREVLSFFEDYDCVLARHLALPLQRQDDYSVTPLVAKEWYDDGSWPRLQRR